MHSCLTAGVPLSVLGVLQVWTYRVLLHPPLIVGVQLTPIQCGGAPFYPHQHGPVVLTSAHPYHCLLCCCSLLCNSHPYRLHVESCCSYISQVSTEVELISYGGCYAFSREICIQALCPSQGGLPVSPSRDFSLRAKVGQLWVSEFTSGT